MKLEASLHPYQEYVVNWIIEHPKSGVFLDMGLGKTISTLTAIDELLNTYELIHKVLVIAPVSVAKATWPAEIDKWEHLKGLTYSLVVGNPKQRLEALDKNVDIYITNREQVKWLVDFYRTDWPFDTVVIDESSSFKDASTQRFKSLKKVSTKIKRLIELTGTPAPNNLMNLWPQIYLMDQGERLGKTVSQFRERYFYAGSKNGHIVYEWILKPEAEKQIYEKLDDLCVSMKAKDYLKLPPRTDNVIEVEMTAAEQKQYRSMEKDFILELPESDVVAVNAAVLANKLLQMANGCIYDENKKPQLLHNQKLDALERIIEDSQGQPILVFYNYKHDRDRILAKFKEAKDLNIQEGDVDKWNRGEIPILLAHPQSAGHGLNLQYGGHLIVWFGLSWSLEYYQQANARLDRQGQTEPVIVHHLVTKGTMDERVLQVLSKKEKGQNDLLRALKAQIEEMKAE